MLGLHRTETHTCEYQEPDIRRFLAALFARAPDQKQPISLSAEWIT